MITLNAFYKGRDTSHAADLTPEIRTNALFGGSRGMSA